MEYVFIVLISLQGLCAASLFWMTKRNNAVQAFRLTLLDQISRAIVMDRSLNGVLDDEQWQWRYDVYRRVTYSQMMWSLKRLIPENYWDDVGFLRTALNPQRTESY